MTSLGVFSPLGRQDAREASSQTLLRSPAGQLTLQELREALDIHQRELGKMLGIKQAAVSRLERRSGIRLSHFKKAVEAMGAELVVIARFPTTEVRLDLERME
jgi:DNA-binding XRE family transcriptional regulator